MSRFKKFCKGVGIVAGAAIGTPIAFGKGAISRLNGDSSEEALDKIDRTIEAFAEGTGEIMEEIGPAIFTGIATTMASDEIRKRRNNNRG